MAHYDVFNGDADGIIALLQLRFSHPKKDAKLITGVKRDIALLEKVSFEAGDSVTVLDISMEKNQRGLLQAIEKGAEVFYVDHHRAGEIPQSNNLEAHIDLDAETCTSLIVDKLLGGKYHDWAIAAAYGDNLTATAESLALQAGYGVEQRAYLKELGVLINYNGYGSSVSDLHFDPAELYQSLSIYPSPFDVQKDKASPYYALRSAYEADFSEVRSLDPVYSSDYLTVFELPDTKASRRVSGVFGNWLANEAPHQAHAVLTRNRDNSYTVSLRAPLDNKQGAGDICAQFSTGGGRAAAAGINALQESQLQEFINKVEHFYKACSSS
ncbi:DHHA1 domain-containing protein [Vibrio sp. 10N]|uniref:DHHA1 domain-containing protein n=1 Tax=Vibrio sp. 10N TaxID=3058938 RepID=UPI002813B9F4|nr:acetyltransferase [Vibrio sp. 10N]